MGGRKAIPEHLKLIKGTQRADRVNKDAPDPAEAKMMPPPWLPMVCRVRFHELRERLSVLSMDSETFTEAAALLAMRIEEIEACNRIIEAEGRTYKSEVAAQTPVVDLEGNQYFPVKVMIKGNPAVAQKNEAMRHLQSLLSEFGLTPASIAKIRVPGGADPKEKDPWSTFGQKKRS